MKIAFDAKRAFLNKSGLGVYSRNLLSALIDNFPDNRYILLTPADSDLFHMDPAAGSVITPSSRFDKTFSTLWRTYQTASVAEALKAKIFHGLSNELPADIVKFSGKKIVTIHDVIFREQPHLYSFFDRTIYDRKTRFACENADVVITVSNRTKEKLKELYNVPEERMKVVPPVISDAFFSTFEESWVTGRFTLPPKYILYVGTIEERKNLANIIRALAQVKHNELMLLVVGRKTDYFKKVEQVIKQLKLTDRVRFLDNVSTGDLPLLFHKAHAFVYPSRVEGFGIPVAESLAAGTAVVTSRGTTMEDAAGPGAIYIDPEDPAEIASAINDLIENKDLRRNLILEGRRHVKHFRAHEVANALNNIYSSLL